MLFLQQLPVHRYTGKLTAERKNLEEDMKKT